MHDKLETMLLKTIDFFFLEKYVVVWPVANIDFLGNALVGMIPKMSFPTADRRQPTAEEI